MKLSEYIVLKKSEGHSEADALKLAKALIKKLNTPWTLSMDNIFKKSWATHVEIKKKVEPQPLVEETNENTVLKHLHSVFDKLNEKSNLSISKKFYTSLWHYYNQLHFSNKLPLGEFAFLKDTGKFFRTRAHYTPSLNLLSFSKRLFNVDFSKFCETFVHELCHQAVHKLDNSVGYYTKSGRRDIHGEPWKKWMRHCKLDPERCDKTDNVEYMNEKEKEETLRIRNEREQQGKDKKQIINPPDGSPVQFYSDDKRSWITGLVACAENVSRSAYVVIIKPRHNSYMRVPAKFLYTVTDKEDLAELSTFEWRDSAVQMKLALTENKKLKKTTTLVKKLQKGAVGLHNFDISIIPKNRREDYLIVAYFLLHTSAAKYGVGSFHVSELDKQYKRSDSVNALYWMSVVDGHNDVNFNESSCILELQQPHVAFYHGKYSLEDFQSTLKNYYS